MHRYLQRHNGRASVESFSLTISHFLVLPPWYNLALHVKSPRFCCITYFLFLISIFPVCLLAHYTLASSPFFFLSFSFFLCLFPSCTVSCDVMTSRCWSTWSSYLASSVGRWRERRETRSWMTIMNPVAMRRRTRRMHPWNTDRSPLAHTL